MGRFISADTTDVLDIQSDMYDKNLYAYCDNNPIMRRDAGGEVWITIGIMAVGGVIGTGINAIGSIATQYMLTDSVNWKSVGVAAASGFISGAVAASPLGLGGQIAVGAGLGAATYAADSVVNGKELKLNEAVVAAGVGALAGRIGGPGANENKSLSETIKISMKIKAKLKGRNNADHAKKRIAAAKRWRNNSLSAAAWEGSARFSVGVGISNLITNTWSKVKSWFSGLFG